MFQSDHSETVVKYFERFMTVTIIDNNDAPFHM